MLPVTAMPEVAAPNSPDREASTSSATPAPWLWSWARWRKGEGAIFFWILRIHAWAIAGLIFLPLPAWPILAITWFVGWLGGIGTSVYYHRALAHNSVRLHPAAELVFAALAIFNGNGSPATWTANHRLHHAKVETEEDISSPAIGGFWWSHLRWLYQAEQAPISRWAPKLDTSYYRSWNKLQPLILAASFLCGLALVPAYGWSAFIWLGPVRLVWTLNAQCFVNSIAHMRRGVAAEEDSSQNVRWLGFLQGFVGENWHRNHHANPASPPEAPPSTR